MDHKNDDKGHTISSAVDLAAVTEDEQTTLFFVDRDGNLASLQSPPRTQAAAQWSPKTLLVKNKSIAASTRIKSLSAVIWGTGNERQIRVYYASTNNILSELCQTLTRASEGDAWLEKPWTKGFLGDERKLDGFPDTVAPKIAPTSSISAAAIGLRDPPKVEILFTEAANPDKIACVYSMKDPKNENRWTWGTKYVGDKPADSTVFIEKPKPLPEQPKPQPVPEPPRRDPSPRPLPPRRQERDCYPYVMLGTGFGFIFGFVMGIVLYEPFGNTRGGSNLWN